MNKFYETLTNLRGDVLFGYRAQVVDETGASVDIYRDRSGTRFTDGSGNIVNYAEASSDTGMAEFYWTAETGHILQITDSSGELARPPIIGFGDNYVLGNLSGDLPTTAIDGLDATLAAKADTTYVDTGLAEKVPTADLASTDTGKGADLVADDTGTTVKKRLNGFKFDASAANYATETAAEAQAASDYGVAGGPFLWIPDGAGGILYPDNQNVYYPEQVGVVADTVLLKDGVMSVEGTDNWARIQYLIDVVAARGGGTIAFEAKGLARTYGLRHPFVPGNNVAMVSDGAVLFNTRTASASSGDTCVLLPGVYTGADTHSLFAEPASHKLPIADAAAGDTSVALDDMGGVGTAALAVGDIVSICHGAVWLTSGMERRKFINTREITDISGGTITLSKPLTHPMETDTASSPLLIKSSGTVLALGYPCGFRRDWSLKGFRLGHAPNGTDRGVMAFGASLRADFDCDVMEGAGSALVANLQVDGTYRVKGKATRKLMDFAYGCENSEVHAEIVKTSNDTITPVLVGERSIGTHGSIIIDNQLQTTAQTMSLADGVDHDLDVILNSPKCNGLVVAGTPEYYPSGCTIRARIEGSNAANYGVQIADNGGERGKRNVIKLVSDTTWNTASAFASNTVGDVPVTVIGESLAQAMQDRAYTTTATKFTTLPGNPVYPVPVESRLASVVGDGTLTNLAQMIYTLPVHKAGDRFVAELSCTYTTPASGSKYIRFDTVATSNALTVNLSNSQTGTALDIRITMTLIAIDRQVYRIEHRDMAVGPEWTVAAELVETVDYSSIAATKYFLFRQSLIAGASLADVRISMRKLARD